MITEATLDILRGLTLATCLLLAVILVIWSFVKIENRCCQNPPLYYKYSIYI